MELVPAHKHFVESFLFSFQSIFLCIVWFFLVIAYRVWI